MKYLFLLLALLATPVVATWDDMEITRMGTWVCQDLEQSKDRCNDGCEYVSTADPTQIPFFEGEGHVDTDEYGITFIQLAGTLVTDQEQIYFIRRILVTAYSPDKKTLYGSQWIYGQWRPGVTVHMLQIQADKLKFIIDYGDPVSVESFALNDY